MYIFPVRSSHCAFLFVPRAVIMPFPRPFAEPRAARTRAQELSAGARMGVRRAPGGPGTGGTTAAPGPGAAAQLALRRARCAPLTGTAVARVESAVLPKLLSISDYCGVFWFAAVR